MNDLQMQHALTLISKPTAHTVLVSFPSYDPPVALSLPRAISSIFITDSSLLIEENSLELFGE